MKDKNLRNTVDDFICETIDKVEDMTYGIDRVTDGIDMIKWRLDRLESLFDKLATKIKGRKK